MSEVRFIRKNGRVIPIRVESSIDSKKKSDLIYSDGGYGRNSSKVKETGKQYREHLGHRDALDKLVHLKGSARKDFKKGIKQGINQDIRNASFRNKTGGFLASAGALITFTGALAKNKKATKGGLILGGLGLIEKGLSSFAKKSAKKDLKNLDRDIKTSEKSWNKYWENNK